MKRFLLSFCFIALLCGCSNYREIERGYLVSAIGIKHSSNNVQIYIEAQTTNFTDKALEKVTLTENGNTLNDAFGKLNSRIVKPLYFEQLGLVVFEKNVTQEDLCFLTDVLKLNLGIYIIKSNNTKLLFDYDLSNNTLGYDVVTLIKNFEKTHSANTFSRFFEVLKTNDSPLLIDIYENKMALFFEGIAQ